MMTAGEIVDMACSEAGMTDDESRAFALVQVDKWHRHICQQELWRELVGVIVMNSLNGLTTDGSYALPDGVDRVLSVRTLAGTLTHKNITTFFQQEPWDFQREGRQVTFTPLAPCVDRYIVDYATSADINGQDRIEEIGTAAIYYPSGLNGASNIGWSGSITYRDSFNHIRTTPVILGSSIPNSTFTGYFLSFQTVGLTNAVREIIAFSQVSVEYPVRVYIYNATYRPITSGFTEVASKFGALLLPGQTYARPRKWIHVGSAPDSISDPAKQLRFLVKREASSLTNEGQVPDITGCENALTAFVKSALLRMDKRGDEANEALQEANALLMQLKQVAVAQEANHQQLTPADGLGSDWQGSPELWNSFKV